MAKIARYLMPALAKYTQSTNVDSYVSKTIIDSDIASTNIDKPSATRKLFNVTPKVTLSAKIRTPIIDKASVTRSLFNPTFNNRIFVDFNKENRVDTYTQKTNYDPFTPSSNLAPGRIPRTVPTTGGGLEHTTGVSLDNTDGVGLENTS